MFSGPICPMITCSTLSGKPEAAGSRRMRLIGSAAWPTSGGFRSSSRGAAMGGERQVTGWMGPSKTFVLVPVSTLCDHWRPRYGCRRWPISRRYFHLQRAGGRQTGSARLPAVVHACHGLREDHLAWAGLRAPRLPSPGRRGERHCTHTAPDTFPRSLLVSGGCRNHSSQHHDSHRCLLCGLVCLFFQIPQRSSVGAIH